MEDAMTDELRRDDEHNRPDPPRRADDARRPAGSHRSGQPADVFVAATPAPTEPSGTTDTGPTPTVDLIGGQGVSAGMTPGASTGGVSGGVAPTTEPGADEASGDEA
jgi:hypothetical protein